MRSYLPWMVIPLVWLGMMTSLGLQMRSGSGQAVSILATDYEIFEPELGPQWYLITREGEIIGYRKVVISEQEIAERPYRLVEESKLRMPVGGAEALVQYTLTSELDPAFSPALITGEISIGQINVTLSGERQDETFVLTITLGDEAVNTVVAVAEGMMTTAGLYSRLSTLAWEIDQEQEFQVFDPFVQASREYTIRYLGEKSIPAEDSATRKRFEMKAFGLSSEVVLDERGNLWSEAASDLLVQQVDIGTVSAIYRELN